MNIPRWLDELEEGKTPADMQVLKSLTIGKEVWLSPFLSLYLDRFIKGENGAQGSKVKFLISNDGSGGKTHLLHHLVEEGLRRGYIAIYLKASDLRLNYIDNIYRAIVNAIDLENLLSLFRNRIIRVLGYDPGEIPESVPFVAWAEEKGENRNILERNIRIELGRLLGNPKIDRSFSVALIRLINCDLKEGIPWNEPEKRQILIDWLQARPELSLSQIKKENIFVRICRKNARRMICSLSEFVKLSGVSGLIVCIDELEELLAPRIDGKTGFRYSKMAREDAYESIRELIDDQDVYQGTLFVFAARRNLVDDESRGVKSYQALWMRIREEIIPEKALDPYVDLLDLDRLWLFTKKEELVHSLWRNLCFLCNEDIGEMKLREPDSQTMTSVIEINPFNIRQVTRILARYLKNQFCQGRINA